MTYIANVQTTTGAASNVPPVIYRWTSETEPIQAPDDTPAEPADDPVPEPKPETDPDSEEKP